MQVPYGMVGRERVKNVVQFHHFLVSLDLLNTVLYAGVEVRLQPIDFCYHPKRCGYHAHPQTK